MNEKKKRMTNIQKAHNAPRHRYEDMPYEDRAEELHRACRKYLLREEPDKQPRTTPYKEGPE